MHDARFRFFGGKGGAGKTTCAAALALTQAEAGRRVLLVSVDPAHSLGDALACKLSSRLRRIQTRRGVLEALELDAPSVFARWLTDRRPALKAIALAGTYLDADDIDKLLDLSFPGLDELLALVELTRLPHRFDEVIVDTAPTGHTLRLLAAPATLQLIAAVLDRLQAKHRFMAGTLAGTYRADISDQIIAELETDATSAAERLRDPARTDYIWVTLPETLSVAEALDGASVLRRERFPLVEVIVNRVTPPRERRCPLCEGKREAERLAIRPLQAALPRLLRFVPELTPEPRGLAALRRIGRELTARPTSRLVTRRARAKREGGAIARIDLRQVCQPATSGDGTGALPIGPELRLLLFAGKGGVGKSTCAAAVALAVAALPRQPKVLLLSTDPAHSLGDVFGQSIGDTPTRLRAAPPNLYVRELDARHAFESMRAEYRSATAELFRKLTRHSGIDIAFEQQAVESLIDLAPPGIDELFALQTAIDLLVPGATAVRAHQRVGSDAPARSAFDLLIVDMAPTGHALRLLQLPQTARRWAHTLISTLLKYRELIGLGRLARDLVQFSKRLTAVESLLIDPARTGVVAVTRGAALPHAETVRLLEALERLQIPLSAIILDQATWGSCSHCVEAAARETGMIKLLTTTCTSLYRRRCDIILAPAVAPPPRGVQGLTTWGARWVRWRRPGDSRDRRVTRTADV